MTIGARRGEVYGIVGVVPSDVVIVRIAPGLRLFLPSRHSGGSVSVVPDGTSTLGHVVESVGVPLPEVGALRVGGRPVPASYRPRAGDVADVDPVARPQPLDAVGFLLDVHLGALARRLRVLGVDTAYSNSADDDELIRLADEQDRMLLTQDRRLLHRRALRHGAFVRGSRPDEQLHDVLDRFEPPLAPWTRCTACNAMLSPVAKRDVEHLLEPGTRRTYDDFARCPSCGRVYWRGAHARRLNELVAWASRRAASGPPAPA